MSDATPFTVMDRLLDEIENLREEADGWKRQVDHTQEKYDTYRDMVTGIANDATAVLTAANAGAGYTKDELLGHIVHAHTITAQLLNV